MKFFSITLSLILASVCGFAQYTVTGRVISQADTKPVANASVFISNATIGDHTAADGSFKLNNVKPGIYQLVISNIGFDTYNQQIIVANQNIDLKTVTIYPRQIALSGVTIKAKAGVDPDRANYLAAFTDIFLGKSDLAKDCKILNPDMLDFEHDAKTNTLSATSADFLIIQNAALGYNVKYLLKNFTVGSSYYSSFSFSYSGSVLFEPMKGDADQEREWQQRRQEVYEGSQMHFLRSAAANSLEREGFRVWGVMLNPQRPADNIITERVEHYNALKNDKLYRDSLNYWQKKAALPRLLDKLSQSPLTKDDIISGPDARGLYTLNTNGNALYISYSKYHHFGRGSLGALAAPGNKYNSLIFNGPAIIFDRNGMPVNPGDAVYYGAWVNNRVPSLLPSDYEPAQTMETEVDSALVKRISAKVNAYSATHTTEKAYLHFDKPYYTAGDTIYFKAYLTQGEAHVPSQLSGVLYVNLIDPDNKVRETEKLQVNGGVTWGDFALSKNLPKGSYRVRAYTQWMRNEDDAAFFDKHIPVAALTKKDIPENVVPVQKAVNLLKPEIKFLPEAGNLVAGVQNKVAFKAIGSDGLGIDVKGAITDESGKPVTSFESAHLGMGFFYLTPAVNKTYTAAITYPDGTQDNITLPKASESEVGISIFDSPRAWSVKISSGKQWFQQNKNKSFTLVIYSAGMPHSFTIKLGNPVIDLDILKQDFPSGIATATLFSSAGEPLCERLLFVQNNDQLKLNIGSEKRVYSARTKTGINLKIQTASGQPAQGHFSVAVIDESKVPVEDNSESTIINNLLFTSDLKGFVEQPAYYFAGPNDKTTADLDLVMLTHGYRKLEWQNVLKPGDTALAWKPEKGLIIGGNVKRNGKPVEHGSVRLFGKIGGGMVLDTVTDKNGRFVFNNLAFADTAKFVLQARTATGIKDVDVKPDSLLDNAKVAVHKITVPQLNNSLAVYTQSNRQFLEEQDKAGINKSTVMLKEVTIKDKKVNLFEHSQNLNGPGNADQTLTAADIEDKGFITLYDALQAKANFVHFTKAGPVSTRSISGAMAIIIDGTVQYSENAPPIRGGFLAELFADDIESVEILLGAHYGAIYGQIAAGGAIIITTKPARRVNNYYKEAPGVITVKPGGFYKARKFYAPKYEHPVATTPIRDLRSTIYWNPEVITDADGKASFDYYNADGSGNYQVVVEGIDNEGNLGRQVYFYRVE